MCLIAIAVGTARFPLVIAANRDEDYARPTLPASFWPDRPDILGGRDALHGGTWLAISHDGRFAAVTNLRGSRPDPQKRSRGELVTGFLDARVSPQHYIRKVADRASEYAGFHLIAGDRAGVMQLSDTAVRLPSGVHALSNAPAGERWPKVETAETEVQRIIERSDDADALVDAVLEFLAQRRGTGRVESEVFIAGERYGTRSSTAIVMTAENEVVFAEQSFARGGVRDGEIRNFRYTISTP